MNQSPEHLDVRRFAQESAQLEGDILLSKLERLAQDLSQPAADFADNSSPALTWQAQGQTVEKPGSAAQIWLHLQLQASVPMQCQRCMGSVHIPLEAQRSFRFVRNEAEADEQDDDAQEDLLVLEKQFNLIELIEDEAIMALPMVPMHEQCPGAVNMTSNDAEFQAAQLAKPNAFAALGQLKKKSGD